MKKLIVLVVLLVVLLAAAAVAVLVYADRAVKVAVEKGGTYAMGVDTKLGNASVGVLSGRLGLNDLVISNPAGYKSDRFFGMGSTNVAVSLPSLRQPVIEVPTLALEDITINLEKANGKANYQVILDNLKRFESGSGGKGEEKPQAGEEKRFVIKDLSIRNVKVHVDLLPEGGQLTTLNIPIDAVELKDVGTAGKGVPLSELANIIVKALLSTIADKTGTLLPGEILGDLRGGLAQLANLDQLGITLQSKVGEEAQKLLDNAGKQIDKAAEDLKKKADDAVNDATKKVEEGLKNLLPGKK
ncbi:MAG TPA: hypothetical protein VK176_01165 [Phycisphaerales bacterium]|nr:hypothetical protein [Phycisphaerales bacterium]